MAPRDGRDAVGGSRGWRMMRHEQNMTTCRRIVSSMPWPEARACDAHDGISVSRRLMRDAASICRINVSIDSWLTGQPVPAVVAADIASSRANRLAGTTSVKWQRRPYSLPSSMSISAACAAMAGSRPVFCGYFIRPHAAHALFAAMTLAHQFRHSRRGPHCAAVLKS